MSDNEDDDARPLRRLPPARVRVRAAPTSEEPLKKEDAPEPPAEPAEYKVGYGRPPLHTRFKKGEVHNPQGRPKQQQNFWTIYEQERNAAVTARSGGRAVKTTPMRLAMRQLFTRAATGDMKAIELVIRYELSRDNSTDAAPRETPLTPEEEADLIAILKQAQTRSSGGGEE